MPTQTSFAAPSDLAARLGQTFTDEQNARAQALLDQAAGAIAGVCSKDQDWIAGLDPVPQALRTVSLEAAVRVFINPAGLRATTLGAFSQTFAGNDSSLALTTQERLDVRRAVFGSTTSSSRAPSALDDLDQLDPSSIGDRIWLPGLGVLDNDDGSYFEETAEDTAQP